MRRLESWRLWRRAWLLTLCAVALLAGCSRGDQARSGDYKSVASMEAEVALGPMAYDDEREVMSPSPVQAQAARASSRSASEPERPEPAPQDAKPQVTRQVVYTSWLRLAAHDVAKALEDARALTERLGGFVQASSAARLVLRVPAARHDEAIEALKALGEVRSLRMHTEDVTDQYTDLVARLDNLRALKARYEALLLEATRMEDRLAIERELRRITQALQALEEQLVVLKDRVALATITLEAERIQPRHLTRATPSQPFAFARGYGAQSLLE
jgi:hypothetical protein